VQQNLYVKGIILKSQVGINTADQHNAASFLRRHRSLKEMH